MRRVPLYGIPKSGTGSRSLPRRLAPSFLFGEAGLRMTFAFLGQPHFADYQGIRFQALTLSSFLLRCLGLSAALPFACTLFSRAAFILLLDFRSCGLCADLCLETRFRHSTDEGF